MSGSRNVGQMFLEMILDTVSAEEKLDFVNQMAAQFKTHLEAFHCHVPALVICVHGKEGEDTITHVLTEKSELGETVQTAVEKFAEEVGSKTEKHSVTTH